MTEPNPLPRRESKSRAGTAAWLSAPCSWRCWCSTSSASTRRTSIFGSDTHIHEFIHDAALAGYPCH